MSSGPTFLGRSTLQNLGGKQSDVRFTPAANMVFQTAKLDTPNIGEPQPELKEVRSHCCVPRG